MSDKAALIPETVNNFNVYKEGNALIGVSGEVALTDISAITETITGAGILGEIESVVVGHFATMDQEIPFRMLDEDIFSIADPTKAHELTLRSSRQSTVKATGASVTLSLLYILIEMDGNKKFELDKLNNVFKINDVDILKNITLNC